MSTLEVVSAGAGSGKTWDVCETIANRVAKGLDPARILATTFTRKAAAELKGRIQARLIERQDLPLDERLRKAERMELAVAGTIHSVGHQLLSRFAIALGLSPSLTVLEEDAGDRCLQGLVATMDQTPWEELAALGRMLSMDSVTLVVQELLKAKRANLIDDEAFRVQMTENANRVTQVLAPKGPNSGGGFSELYALAEATIADIEAKSDKTDVTKKAVTALRRLVAGRRCIWTDFLTAANLNAGKKSGADACLQELREQGASVRGILALHQDIHELLRQITEHVVVLENDYETYKKERGLVDFTDLEVLLLRLLHTEELADALREEFDLVVVDEFQDTNPLQLAIFQRLRDLAQASRWVGDPKQAIYGFRGTDPQLVNNVWANAAATSRRTLPDNHRSQKGLVEAFGTLFVPTLGDTTRQNPKRPALRSGIERWLLQTTKKPNDHLAIAAGIAQLQQQGIPLRDIAVLARTNRASADIAAAFGDLGIPVLIARPGLLTTREGALTVAGLRLVADGRDSLAAATALHILTDPSQSTPAWLEDRLSAVKKLAISAASDRTVTSLDLWKEHPRLVHLSRIDHRTLPPSVTTELVIEALAVADSIPCWGDATRRMAHLDAIVELAKVYEGEAWEAGTAATLSGFIAYLEDLAARKLDTRLPPYGLDAVTLLTYHAAKGLQWPVVVLTGLDFGRSPDLWRVTVTGGNAGSETPLAGRTLRYWPWPFGVNTYGERPKGCGLDQDAIDSPEGQQAKSEAEKEAMRLLYVGFTRARDKLVLAHRPDEYDWLASLRGVDALLDPALPDGEHSLAGVDTTYVVRRLDEKIAEQYRRSPLDQERWLETTHPSPERSEPGIQRYHSPSAAEPSSPKPAIRLEQLEGPAIFPTKAVERNFNAIGDAVHAYLGSLRSLSSLEPDKRQVVASRCLRGFGVESLLPVDRLVVAGDRFLEWLGKKYPNATMHTEVSLTAPRQNGGQWNGVVDVLLVLPNGDIVVIDHKSAPLRRNQCSAKAATYAGQIEAYRQGLESQGLRVAETWIHFPLAGVVCALE